MVKTRRHKTSGECPVQDIDMPHLCLGPHLSLSLVSLSLCHYVTLSVNLGPQMPQLTMQSVADCSNAVLQALQKLCMVNRQILVPLMEILDSWMCALILAVSPFSGVCLLFLPSEAFTGAYIQ